MQIQKRNENMNRTTKYSVKTMVLVAVALIAVFSLALVVLYKETTPGQLTASAPIEQELNVAESEGGVYLGHMIDVTYVGEGTFRHLDGGIYVGDFYDSYRSGEGTFSWTNGDRFDGSWSGDDMLEGTYYFADGASFTGTFAENRFENGTYDLGDSCKDKGFSAFQAELKDGNVVRLSFQSSAGLSYNGDVSGTAEITYPSGNRYSGDVVNGVREGNGLFQWYDDGSLAASYQGSWQAGEMEGAGTYYFSSGQYPYITGSFADGKPDGKAIYYKESGNTFSTTWSGGTCTAVTES